MHKSILDVSEETIRENATGFEQKSNKKFQIIINPKPKTEINTDMKPNNLKKKRLVDYDDEDEEEKFENGFSERKILLFFQYFKNIYLS